jgi:hypothetical protein
MSAKTNLQSGLARKQLAAKEILQKHTRRGERTDLIPRPTCTPDGVQVASRRESCTEKVAALYGEGAGAVRRRICVYERAHADPAKYEKFLKRMDMDKSPYSAFDLLRAAERMERIADESVPQHASSRVLPGDLWNLGSHRLYCGNATIAVDVDRLLGGAVPHLMVTDPPYGDNYQPGWRKKIGNNNLGKMGEVSNDDRHDWSEAWALFPGDVGYVWFSGRHAASVQLSLEDHQLIVRNLIVWEKNRPVIFARTLLLASGNLLLCSKGGQSFSLEWSQISVERLENRQLRRPWPRPQHAEARRVYASPDSKQFAGGRCRL